MGGAIGKPADVQEGTNAAERFIAMKKGMAGNISLTKSKNSKGVPVTQTQPSLAQAGPPASPINSVASSTSLASTTSAAAKGGKRRRKSMKRSTRRKRTARRRTHK